jgi:hypothetical protein
VADFGQGGITLADGNREVMDCLIARRCGCMPLEAEVAA